MKKNLMTTLSGLLTVLTLGCGGSGGGDRAGAEPESSGAALELSNLGFDATTLTKEGRKISWNAKLVVQGQTAFDLRDADWDGITKKVRDIRVRPGDSGTMELTASDGVGPQASNVAGEADKNPALKAKWDNECAANVTTKFDVKDTDIKEGPLGKTVRLTLKLCDFGNILVIPALKVEPAVIKQTKYTVVYKCPIKVTHASEYNMVSNSTSICEYGYDADVGEAVPEMYVPKTYAQGTAQFEANKPRLSGFTVERESNGIPYAVSAQMSTLPFGSHSGCYRQVIDFQYGDMGTVKHAKAIYKRLERDNGRVIWSTENAAALPSFSAVWSYYHGAAANSATATLYRFCEWSPEVMGDSPETAIRL